MFMIEVFNLRLFFLNPFTLASYGIIGGRMVTGRWGIGEGASEVGGVDLRIIFIGR